MFAINDRVQIYNHSDDACNAQYGTVTHVDVLYNGSVYYTVVLDYSHTACICTEDEVMEG